MKKLLVILLLLVTIGCAKKYTKTAGEEAARPETVKKEEVLKPEKTSGMEDEVIEEAVIFEDSKVQSASIDETAEEAQAAAELKDVLFEYDSYAIASDARPVLNRAASFLNSNKKINVLLEGHCDERGTNEYNLALGEKRAKSVKNYLVSLGVSPDRINVITYGEEKPACTEQSESCWQQNRRAHFVIVQ